MERSSLNRSKLRERYLRNDCCDCGLSPSGKWAKRVREVVGRTGTFWIVRICRSYVFYDRVPFGQANAIGFRPTVNFRHPALRDDFSRRPPHESSVFTSAHLAADLHLPRRSAELHRGRRRFIFTAFIESATTRPASKQSLVSRSQCDYRPDRDCRWRRINDIRDALLAQHKHGGSSGDQGDGGQGQEGKDGFRECQ